MKSVKWRVVLCRAFSLAGVSVVLFGALTAAATEVVIAPPDKGTLILRPGAYGKLEFRWDRIDEQSDIVQKIVDKSSITHRLSDLCALVLQDSTPTPGGLVTLPTNAGFLGDHIGIRSSGLCSEISGSESLRLALRGLLAGYQVYHTELNLEMKQNAVVRIVTQLGTGATQTFTIQSPGPAYGGAELCAFETVTSEHDICRWKSDAVWDSATITVLRGRVSIEAGSGGGGGDFSKFSLTQFDDTLPCAPSEGGPDIGLTVEDEESGAVAVLTRLQNSDPEEGCEPIPVALEWDGEVLNFFKADLGQSSVVTTFTITWPSEAAPAPGDNGVLGAIPLSQQVFGDDEPIDLDLCVGTPTGYVPDPDPTHPGEFLITGLDGIPETEDQFGDLLDGFQYGCVYERRITYPNVDTIAVKEWIYLTGDWGASRAF